MRAGFLILKYIKYISLLVFIVLLFVAYYYLPEMVPVHYDPYGHADEFLSKSTFFYAAGIFIVLFNMVMSLLSRFVFIVPLNAFMVPNRKYWASSAENRREFYEIVEDWLNFLTSFVNCFLVLCLYAILRINTSLHLRVFDYTWILPIGAALLFVWILFLPTRLLIRRKALLE